MHIININGPINSGKSTISKLLEKELSNTLFIEVDDLLSDEEQDKLGLSMEQGWQERTNRLAKIIKDEKQKKVYNNIVFAYPISENLYHEWKLWQDENTRFINVTLAPKLEVCLTNRGTRELEEDEKHRIVQMYEEGYHNRAYSDLIIDNSVQTPSETLDTILNFLRK